MRNILFIFSTLLFSSGAWSLGHQESLKCFSDLQLLFPTRFDQGSYKGDVLSQGSFYQKGQGNYLISPNKSDKAKMSAHIYHQNGYAQIDFKKNRIIEVNDPFSNNSFFLQFFHREDHQQIFLHEKRPDSSKKYQVVRLRKSLNLQKKKEVQGILKRSIEELIDKRESFVPQNYSEAQKRRIASCKDS